jgi:FixJ family two-component response regulator
MPETPVVHVVDDDESVREALRRLLGSLGFTVRLHASAGEFLAAWPVDSPGCLLLDLVMPGAGGLELQQALARQEDAPPVVFMSGQGDVRSSVLAMRRGAVDFLTKPIDSDALQAAVTEALRLDGEWRGERQRRRDLQDKLERLTRRERAVFEQVVAGRLNKQIADALHACERTIKADRAHVMETFQVRTVADLVRVAVQIETERSDAA